MAIFSLFIKIIVRLNSINNNRMRPRIHEPRHLMILFIFLIIIRKPKLSPLNQFQRLLFLINTAIAQSYLNQRLQLWFCIYFWAILVGFSVDFDQWAVGSVGWYLKVVGGLVGWLWEELVYRGLYYYVGGWDLLVFWLYMVFVILLGRLIKRNMFEVRRMLLETCLSY